MGCLRVETQWSVSTDINDMPKPRMNSGAVEIVIYANTEI